MQTLTKQEILTKKDFYLAEIKSGKIFIYPTDTVLGVGANAQNSEAVKKIMELKNRPAKSLLVIVPGFVWLEENCEISSTHWRTIKTKLPGAYSFIVKLKNISAVCREVTNFSNTIGVRIPDCWFTDLITEANVPFVSTSVNLSGESPTIKIDQIPPQILSAVDYVITDEQPLSGQLSTIIDLTGEEANVLR